MICAPDSAVSTLLDCMTDAVLLSNDDGVIVYVNDPLLRLFGYDNDELVGQKFELLITYYDELDGEGRHADGSRFPVDVQLSALPDSVLVVASVRDMTTHRQSYVDNAIARIDLANARTRIDQLQKSLDLVIQGLFALGTSIMASATSDKALSEQMDIALHGIDEVIETVQQSRQPVAST